LPDKSFRLRRKSLILLFCLLYALSSHAQELDRIFEKVNSRLLSGAKEDLFLHLDKSLYGTSEKIWFTAYTLGTSIPVDSLHTLNVVLINDMSQKVVAFERYVLENGMGSGSIRIPDSLQTGEYSLIAYSNIFAGQPQLHNFFRQPIDIVGLKPSLKIGFATASPASHDSVFIMTKIVRTGGGIPANAELVYHLYGNGRPIRNAKVKVNQYGEAAIPLASFEAIQTLELRGVIKEGKEETWFKVPVQWESKDYILRLLAEGGTMVDGQPTKLYFQLSTTAGQGISERLELIENGRSIQSFDPDVYGTGFISIMPNKGSSYEVKLVNDPTKKILQQFPAIAETGYTIGLAGISNDSLSLALTTPRTKSTSVLAVHNNSEVIEQLAIRLENGKGKLVLPVKDWPAGACTVSLFDEDGQLKTQNMVMIKPDTSQIISITTDSTFYHARSKITVHISVKNKEGKPLWGAFSFASALSATIKEDFTDIVWFHFLNRFMPEGYLLPASNYLRNEQFLSYCINQGLSSIPSEHVFPTYTLPWYDGQVLLDQKKIKKPVEIVVVSKGVATIKTDENGYFKIPLQSMRGDIGNSVVVSVSAKNTIGYNILLDSSAYRLNDLLAKQYFRLTPVIQKDEATAQQKQEIQSAKGKTLQTVVVKAKKNDDMLSFGTYTSPDCRDWVCLNGILNCRNHPTGTAPIEGQAYPTNARGVTGTVVYHCALKGKYDQPGFAFLKPVYYNDMFPAPDFSLANDLIAPEVLKRTTLHWAPIVFTDNNGEASLSFYANDVTGNFTGMLQGITKEGVIHGKVVFKVK